MDAAVLIIISMVAGPFQLWGGKGNSEPVPVVSMQSWRTLSLCEAARDVVLKRAHNQVFAVCQNNTP